MRIIPLVVAGAFMALAHDPVTTKLTWSAEISRIIYKRCAGCHRDGGSAPMSLTSFGETKPWATAIREEVLNRRMPPWGAVKGFGEFREDLSLTQDEIARIAQWVEGGVPEGDPRYLPTALPPRQPALSAPYGVGLQATTLSRPQSVLAIRPLANVAQAKITAHQPDGTVVPLLWLLNYQAKWKRTFVYLEPSRLPEGTRLISRPSVPFELVVKRSKSRKPAR